MPAIKTLIVFLIFNYKEIIPTQRNMTYDNTMLGSIQA